MRGMGTMLVTAGSYRRRIRLTDQPREGPRFQVQYQMILTVQGTRQPEKKMQECMSPDEPYIGLKNNK